MPDIRYPTPDAAVARDAIRSLGASQIREIANAGMHDPDVLAFWFGEPEEVRPQFIRDAAVESLARGETFYSQSFGIPELRAELVRRLTRLHGRTSAIRQPVSVTGNL